MKNPVKVLYIQHASSVGGSVVSLKELIIDAISFGYDCTVVCSNNEAAKVYQSLGAQTWVTLISPWNHNTAYFYRLTPLDFLRIINVTLKTFLSFIKLTPILRKVKPDIVHLNSSNLILYTLYFKILRVPTILHVRENIVDGYFGIRKRLIRFLANKATTLIIFISEFELEILKTSSVKSFVVYNYVHEASFKKGVTTSEEGITPHESFKLITLGGLFSLKGGLTILRAFEKLDQTFQLIILGGDDPRINPEEITGWEGQQYVSNLKDLLFNLRDRITLVGRVNDPAKYIAGCDGLIFWAGSPHFPRPVFEAWLLNKPVIYYNPGFSNRYINAETVFLASDESPQALANVIADLSKHYSFLDKRIKSQYLLAQSVFTEQNFEKINRIYQGCLNPKH